MGNQLAAAILCRRECRVNGDSMARVCRGGVTFRPFRNGEWHPNLYLLAARHFGER